MKTQLSLYVYVMTQGVIMRIVDDEDHNYTPVSSRDEDVHLSPYEDHDIEPRVTCHKNYQIILP